MAKTEKNIIIHSTPERVFDYLDAITTLPEIWPSFIDATDIERRSDGGPRFRYVYKMAGMRFNGVCETIDYAPPHRHVLRSTADPGGISATITWTLAPVPEGTDVTVEADYEVPIPLVRGLAEPFIVRQNDREAMLVLDNLKSRLEA